MSVWERSYMTLLSGVLNTGDLRPSRAGDTLSVFGEELTIDALVFGGFPLLTTRKMYPRGVFGELAAFLKGAETVGQFEAEGCNYWFENARNSELNEGRGDGELLTGPIYGAQWINWNADGINQIAELVQGIKQNPYGRRHVVSCWNPSELHLMCLPPCHIMFQCYVSDSYLDMMVYMRSVDLCVGLPSDIVLYAMLLKLLANDVDLLPGTLKFVFGDAHVYTNHIDQAELQLLRTPYELDPEVNIPADMGTTNFQPDQVDIVRYISHDPIKYIFNV